MIDDREFDASHLRSEADDLDEAGDKAGAEAKLREAAAILAALPALSGYGKTIASHTATALSDLLVERGALQEAEALLLARKEIETDLTGSAWVRQRLGKLFEKKSDQRNAERWFREALALGESAGDEGLGTAIGSADELIWFLDRRGRREDSELEETRAIVLRKRLLERAVFAFYAKDDRPPRERLGAGVFPVDPDDAMTLRYGRVESAGMLRAPFLFGPERDFECECGAVRGRDRKGEICETCHVEIVASSSRTWRCSGIDLGGLFVNPRWRPVVTDALGVGEAEFLARADRSDWDRDPDFERAKDRTLARILLNRRARAGLLIETLIVPPPDAKLPKGVKRAALESAFEGALVAVSSGKPAAIQSAVDSVFAVFG